MTGPAPRVGPVLRGENSAQPVKPKRRKPKPGGRHLEHQGIRLVVRADGSFVPADLSSRKVCRDRKLYAGVELVGYLYEPRDGLQWRQAHVLGTFLVEHVEGFEDLNAHTALKKIQTDAGIAMDSEVIDLGKLGKVTRSVPKSLGFGWMLNGDWLEVYRAMCSYIGRTYMGLLDGDVVADMEKLMIREKAA